jgi:hypothetical protein
MYTGVFHAILIISLFLSSSFLSVTEPMQKNDRERIFSEGAELIEYRPLWLADRKKDFSPERGKSPLIFTEGSGTVEIVSWKSQSRTIKAIAENASTLRIATFYYPGWTALINGKEVPLGIEQDSGAMLLSLPAGVNTVFLEFRDTPLRRTAGWVSILSLVAAMIGLVVERRKRNT